MSDATSLPSFDAEFVTPSPAAPAVPVRQQVLADTLVEVEEHVAQLGWDRPVIVLALVRTAAALESDPDLAALIPEETRAQAEQNPEALTAVMQEDLPAASTLQELLAQLSWPGSVDGVAICTESTIVPADVEAEAMAIQDAQERQDFLLAHERRQDVRVVAGVLRSGESWSVIRARGNEGPSGLTQGEALVPALTEGLMGTLRG